jgi:hypothetical protein
VHLRHLYVCAVRERLLVMNLFSSAPLQ